MKFFRREMNHIRAILSGWSQKERLWLHLHGETGCGRKELIGRVKDKLFSNHRFSTTIDLGAFPIHSRHQLRQIIYHLIQHDEDLYISFSAQYTAHVRAMLDTQLSPTIQEAAVKLSKDQWENQLLYEFLNFASQREPLVLVLPEMAETKDGFAAVILQQALRLSHRPLVVLTSGTQAYNPPETHPPIRNILVPQRTVRETEKIVATVMKTDAMSSRLITNHMFIKSGGNLQKIRFMLAGYYSHLLDEPTGRGEVDNLRLQQMRVSGKLEDIFAELRRGMSEEMENAFSFLCRLKDPLPMALWEKLLRLHGLGKRETKRWLVAGLLNELNYFGETFIAIAFLPWKRYLQNSCAIYRLQPTLSYLSRNLSRFNLTRPLELSSLYFDAGEFHLAIRHAALEAERFAAAGDPKRAMDRYAFLRRNLSHFSRNKVQQVDVLRKMGYLQFKQGLYDNAFDSFRELRDRLRRDQRYEWVESSLQMANALFKMDLHSEAHYLIKDLKMKEDVPAYVHAFSYVLNGELEQNFGRPTYALKSYRRAAALLPGMNDDVQAMNLFMILRERFRDDSATSAYTDLIANLRKSLHPESPYQAEVGVEAVRQWVRLNQFEFARELSLTLLRRHYRHLTPRMSAQIRLYLAEIYAYYGKWHLSRNYLRRLLANPLLVASGNIRAQVLLNLGVVEKELGIYGRALDTLQEALEITRKQRLQRQSQLVKVHLGHVYLLVHAHVRAYEYLRQALKWSQEHRENEIVFTALLLLASYSMQQEQLPPAERYLEKALALLDKNHNRLDHLNYAYYRSIFLLKSGDLSRAETAVASMDKDSKGMFKFEHLSHYLKGRVLMARSDFEGAKKRFEKALSAYRRHRMAYQELQIYREYLTMARIEQDHTAEATYEARAREAFERLLSSVDDHILQRQIEESSEFESLLISRTGND